MRSARSFQAYKSVAPLKPKLGALIWRKNLMFPRLQKRGPIEADILCEVSSSVDEVSTLTKAWPH